jgi:hypothetical protein
LLAKATRWPCGRIFIGQARQATLEKSVLKGNSKYLAEQSAGVNKDEPQSRFSLSMGIKETIHERRIKSLREI